MTTGLVGIVGEVIRTRRLADVASPLRLRTARARRICCAPGADDETKGSSMTDYIDVDVRPILRAGGEPFSVIMSALERLQPGRGCLYRHLQTDSVVRRHGGQGICAFRAGARRRRVGGAVHAGRSETAGRRRPCRHLDLRQLARARASGSTIATSSRRSRWFGFWPPPRSWGRAKRCRRCCGAKAGLSVSATGEARVSLARRFHAGRRHL